MRGKSRDVPAVVDAVRVSYRCHRGRRQNVSLQDAHDFKMAVEKKFLTKFGVIVVSRRIFQQDNGGQTFIPLDVA